MEINEVCLRLMQTTKEFESLDFFMGEADLTKTEFRLLREVLLERKRGGEIISSELARRLGVTRSAISQIVTKLEAKQLVKRVASPTDKKIAYVRLSDSAEETFMKNCVCANEFMQNVIEAFGADRMKAFLREYDALFQVMMDVKKKLNVQK